MNMPFSASAVPNPNPGSPVFSPSSRRLPPSLLSFSSFDKDTPEPHRHIYTSASALPGSPLRPPSLLRAQHQHQHRREAAACSPSPCKPATHHQFAAVTTRLVNRRRPPPLLVPVQQVTTLLQEQEQEQEQKQEQVEKHEMTAGYGFAAYCRKGKGRRRVHMEMEDRHVAAVGLGGDPHTAFFGVFDGHGGKAAAEFAANNMPRIVAQELQTRSSSTTTAVQEAVRRAYLRTDAEFSSADLGSGACCVTALLRDGRLVVSNAGDCRAVLSRAGEAHPLTSDHRASREDERRRIESQGGFVIDCRGTWRVQGSLAVTRGIGDAHLKPWVVPEPDTTTLPVDATCDFLVLASDGLWDKVVAQEAVDVAGPLCCTGVQQLSAACRRLVELAASRGSTDDITVLILSLSAMSDDL